MTRFLLPLACCAFLLCGMASARADIAPGVNQYVTNATAIFAVQAQTEEEATAFPPPEKMQRVMVRRVLKGVDTTQEFLVPAGSLKPGGTGIVLFQYNSEHDPEPPGKTSPEMAIWAMDGHEKVDTGHIEAETAGEFWGMGKQPDVILPLEVIEKDIGASSPEQVGLYEEVMDALFHPEKFKTLATKDSQRATYVRFVITLWDLERDIPTLAHLLESPDREIRAAAAGRLEKLTDADIAVAKDESPAALAAWTEAWTEWNQPVKKPEWPPVPEDMKLPPDAFPAALVKAVEDCDADAFTKEFTTWLDSGAMRDRQIEFAKRTLRQEVAKSPYFKPDPRTDPLHAGFGDFSTADLFFSGGYLMASPRLPMDIAVNPKVPAEQRIKYMAMLAEIVREKSMKRDRARRLSYVNFQDADSEAVRRAAFWEVGPGYTDTARSIALKKLATVHGKKSNSHQLLMAQYLADNNGRSAPSSDALDAARESIRSGNKEFIAALLEYMRTHEDPPAGWGGRLMCQEHVEAAIPIMLEWLKSKNPEIRSAGAFNLCWIPRRSSVPALLAAIKKEPRPKPLPADGEETDDDDGKHPNIDGEFVEPRGQMIVAVAQTDDPRGLDTLIAAMGESYGEGMQEELVRGLARIRDKKALPALARIAITSTDHGLLAETVNAFDYILHREEGHVPDPFWSSGGTSVEEVQKGVARIKQWEKDQKDRK